MSHTTKFEDYLNKLLKSKDDSVVNDYLFLGTERKVKLAKQSGRLGSLIRVKDSYAFSEMENRHRRGEL